MQKSTSKATHSINTKPFLRKDHRFYCEFHGCNDKLKENSFGQKHFFLNMKILPVTLVLFAFFCFCAHPLDEVEKVIYNPPVVFAGYVNNDYDSLPGNQDWPNTCELRGDTIRMNFRSNTFHVQNGIWYGDLLTITLLPTANDSSIGTRSVYLHMARYFDQNYSYDVAPADTLQLYNNKVEMRALSLSRSHGARIEIDRITAIAKALTGNTGLTIDDGRISGRIP